MMNKFRYLYICLFLMAGLYIYSFLSYAVTNNIQDTRVIILIDISESTIQEQPVIEQSLELLYKWLNEEQRQYIEYWTFGNEVHITSYEEYLKKKDNLEKSTHIAQALKEVDKEVEQSVNKEENIYVIVISDLIASEAKSADYTWDLVEKEDCEVNKILEKWNELKHNAQMDVLFITWGKNKAKILSEIKEPGQPKGLDEIKKQKGFRCNIESLFGNSASIYEISETNDSISATEIAGCLIQRVIEMVEKTEMIVPREKIGRENSLELDSFYKAYVVTKRDNNIYILEGDDKTDLSDYKIETEYMAIYCFPTELSNKNTYKISGDDSNLECYLFYENMPKIRISVNPDKPFENESFRISCFIKNQNLAEMLPQLYIRIKNNDGELISESTLNPNEEGNLITEKMSLKQGQYKIEVCIGEDQYLNTKKLNIQQREENVPDSNKPSAKTKDTLSNNSVIVLSCLMLFMMMILIMLASRKRRSEK